MVQMTTEDYYFLLEDFPKIMDTTLRGDTLRAYERVEIIFSGKKSTPDCSCRYRSYKENVLRIYNKWREKQNT